MKIIVYFSHPSQYLFLRETIKRLKRDGFEFVIIIKTKDVIEDLLISDKIDYLNILPKERGRSKLAIVTSLFRRNFILFKLFIKHKPDLVLGSDASVAQIGKLLGINRITYLEDDYQIIKSLADLTFPFTQIILCPEVCSVGSWNSKKVGYPGYMKLGYLHPNVFKHDKKSMVKYNLPSRYGLVRLARLTAHHDFGIEGINEEFLDKLVSEFENRKIQLYISSEKSISGKYDKYLLNIDPNDMHQILAGSKILISDSQSMSVEAAMLGIPSIRYSSFAGKISVLEELEHKYKLTFGINPNDTKSFFKVLNEIMGEDGFEVKFQNRKKLMLSEKIDVTSFLVWFIRGYPATLKVVKEKPEFINSF